MAISVIFSISRFQPTVPVSLRGTSQQPGLWLLIQPITLTLDIQDGGLVQQTVQDRRSQHWQNLSTLFRHLDDIGKAIYTTSAVESLNSVIRWAAKKRKLFPLDD